MKLYLYACEECGVMYAFDKGVGPHDFYDDDTGELNLESTGVCRVCNSVAVKYLVYVDL